MAKKVGFKVGDTVVTVAQPGQPPEIGTIREVRVGGRQTVYQVQLDGAQFAVSYRRDQIKKV